MPISNNKPSIYSRFSQRPFAQSKTANAGVTAFLRGNNKDHLALQTRISLMKMSARAIALQRSYKRNAPCILIILNGHPLNYLPEATIKRYNCINLVDYTQD